MIPGIEASEDRLLQGRIFSYADTQRHRLGVNNMMLPVNRPNIKVANGNQDGFGNILETDSDVNYQPSRSKEGLSEHKNAQNSQLPIAGTTMQAPIEKTLNFQQAGDFYRGLDKTNQQHLIENLAGDLGQVRDMEIKTKMLAFFYKADKDYGSRLAKAVNVDLKGVEGRAANLKE